MATAFLSLATALPEHRLEAKDALDRLAGYWPELARLEEADASLGTRYLCEPIEEVLGRKGLDELRRRYATHARRLATSAARAALERAGIAGSDVDLVITVSCTGYLVPSLDVFLAADLGFRPDVLRLPITELGCSGGSAAIAMAHRHLAGFPDDRVLVVAVEVPSLSFQPSDHSLDNLTACLVFGDGAGAAVLGRSGPDRCLEVVRAASHLVPNTAGVLGFELRDSGFHVVLDRRLPRVLRKELKPVVERFLAADGAPPPDFYAVHAAGPRIFDAVQSALGVEDGALDVSRRTFARVGNASSAAIFFALEELMSSPRRGGSGLGIGLGPGVSVELMRLAWPA
jgi:predicted naringenin-chalcone synthase